MPFESELTELGLNSKEAEVYLSLAESGKTTAHAASKRLGMPRASVYFLLDALSARGLVVCEKKRGTSFFSANPPSSLVKMLRLQRDIISSKIAGAEELVKQLLPLFKSTGFHVPKLQFVEGKAAIERMLYDSEDEWHESMLQADSTWWGFEDAHLYQHFQAWYQHLWKKFESIRREKLNVRIFTNLPSPPEILKLFPRTFLRPVRTGFDFTATLFLMGDYLFLAVLRQKPYYAFQIKDPVLAANLRVVFQLLWQQ